MWYIGKVVDKNFDTFEVDIRKEDHFLDLYIDELNYYDVLSK